MWCFHWRYYRKWSEANNVLPVFIYYIFINILTIHILPKCQCERWDQTVIIFWQLPCGSVNSFGRCQSSHRPFHDFFVANLDFLIFSNIFLLKTTPWLIYISKLFYESLCEFKTFSKNINYVKLLKKRRCSFWNANFGISI